MQVDFLFQIAVLIISVVIHEVSHGYAASYLGDQTARYQGRLTLNPLKHLDPFGSVILPILLVVSHAGFVFGWAKPVPYNPYNLKSGRWSEAFVALAGPISNITIALIFGIFLRVSIAGGLIWANAALIYITAMIVFTNILLAVFNLVPIPPLDGSKLLFAIFPDQFRQIRGFFESYGFVLIVVFIFFLWQFIFPVITLLFRLITGVAF